jgi:hypothetical protein
MTKYAYVVVNAYDRDTKKMGRVVRGYEIERETTERVWFAYGEQPLAFGSRRTLWQQEWDRTPEAALRRFRDDQQRAIDKAQKTIAEAGAARLWATEQLEQFEQAQQPGEEA